MRLLFKFKERAQPHERERVLARLREQGAGAVEPLFPNASEPELTSMFVIDTDDDAAAQLLRRLKRTKTVEYAESELRRKLVS